MKKKYQFIKEPSKEDTWGEWRTSDGFRCYSDSRERAVRLYKKYLDDNKHKSSKK